MSDLKLLVVGGGGYIGRAMVPYFDRHSELTVSQRNNPDGLSYVNLEEIHSIDMISFKGISHVIFAAAISSPDECLKDRNKAWRVNVDSTCYFISKAISYGVKVLFLSSDTVYGHKDESFDESCEPNPIGSYAEMKYYVERKFSGNNFFKSIRLSYVFSKNDSFTSYLSESSKSKKEVEIFHPFYRSVIYLNDVLDGMLSLLLRWDDISESNINFGGEELLSRVELTQILKEVNFTSLHYKVVSAPIGFFKARAGCINMKSPILHGELLTKSHRIRQAVTLEFN